MERDVLLELPSGQVKQARLAHELNPEEDMIEVLMPGSKKARRLRQSQVCCVCIKGEPLNEMSPDDVLEEVEITSGKVFQVHTNPAVEHKFGFYGYALDRKLSHRLLFFYFFGVRMRRHFSPVGEILENQGSISRDAIKKALGEQRQLKQRRVGDILADHKRLDQKQIDKMLREAQQAGTVPPRIRVGDILVASGLVTKEELEEALANQLSDKKKKIGPILIERGLITEEQMLAALATKFRLRFVDLEEFNPSPKILTAISREIVFRLRVMAVEDLPDRLVVATSDPVDPSISDTLHFHTGRRVELVVATSRQIGLAIEKYYGVVDGLLDDIIGNMTDEAIDVVEETYDDGVDEADSQIIKLVNNVLIDAYHKKASDIHLEPGLGQRPLQVRYRVDGICIRIHEVPSTFKRACIARIKVLANLDFTEHRRPQSGKIVLRLNGRPVEYRVEITPTMGNQEDAVLRILSTVKPMELAEMHFSDQNLKAFKDLLTRPYGIILCVGPTGSGKTTTLHSALAQINTPERKIWTVEDPVEITQPGLRQVQVNPKINFTFQDALRSFLRADPDVIMIGEMRDSETAKIAIEASLTGHLVFSTLHTNTAPETAVRLIEMGMDPNNFAEGLLGILAQRLVRMLCPLCKQAYHPTSDEYEIMIQAYGVEQFTAHGHPPYSDKVSLVQPVGCPVCEQKGYAGRLALHELLVTSPAIKRAIKQTASVEDLRAIAINDSMHTLHMDGIDKVFQGLTDLEQVIKVCV